MCFERLWIRARYWALRISDKTSGRTAFIGFGFRDRDTATELRSAVQDSLQFLDREREAKRLQALDGFDEDDGTLLAILTYCFLPLIYQSGTF